MKSKKRIWGIGVLLATVIAAIAIPATITRMKERN